MGHLSWKAILTVFWGFLTFAQPSRILECSLFFSATTAWSVKKGRKILGVFSLRSGQQPCGTNIKFYYWWTVEVNIWKFLLLCYQETGEEIRFCGKVYKSL